MYLCIPLQLRAQTVTVAKLSVNERARLNRAVTVVDWPEFGLKTGLKEKNRVKRSEGDRETRGI